MRRPNVHGFVVVCKEAVARNLDHIWHEKFTFTVVAIIIFEL